VRTGQGFPHTRNLIVPTTNKVIHRTGEKDPAENLKGNHTVKRDLREFFDQVEETLLALFRLAGFVQHAGDRGENREEILRDFLSKHLPDRYGVAKGEMITKEGLHTHSADIIIYDAANCPVLYAGQTKVVPIEGVYGIIEVKSRLSKEEFLDAARKIESFKRLAPRELSVIRTREYVTVHRPSRPFGIILGFELADNSLDSLADNWMALNKQIHDVNYFVNLVAVLGQGLLYYEKADLLVGEKSPLLDTDEFVALTLTAHKREANKEQLLDYIKIRVCTEESGTKTFGRFFVYLLIMLAKLRLGVADLGRYLDPDLPIMILRES
jgi:hypothetical protein